MTRILDIALNEMWAMEQTALERLLDIAGREHTVDTEALEAYRAKALANAERTTFRDGVAIMAVEGALFPKANLMTDISGATSYDILRRDLQAVLDKGAKALILNIDSPGGAVKGCSEFAQALYEARDKLHIVAYVRGTMASAAFMIGSAAHYIVMNDMAEAGSLGCMMTLRVSDDPKGTKTYEFISSQSPMKNIDPATDAGAKAYQDRVDALAEVFIGTVARNRGVATETALNNFGRGGMFVGKDAVQAGLADAVGNFEAVLADLAGGKKFRRSVDTNKGSSKRMSDKTETTEATEGANAQTAPAAPAAPAVDVTAAVNKAVAEAQAAERTRIAGLNKIASAFAVDDAVLQSAIADGTEVAAFSLKVADLTAEKNKATKDKALEGLKKDEAEASEAGASDGNEPGEKTVDQLAAEIIASANAATGN